MLSLLRKYQKAIFGVVTVVIIASFSFFGTYGSIDSRVRKEVRPFGKGVDGKEIPGAVMEALIHLVDTDIVDARESGFPNLLNDGVIRHDILQTGLGEILFDTYKEEFAREFQDKLNEFHAFKPYVHPQKIIGVESAWKIFTPSYYKEYERFQKMKEESLSSQFGSVAKLYVYQELYPAEMVRQMLLYQQNQYRNWLKVDPYLQSGDLSLFHAKSVKEWFGSEFLHRVAHMIYNASLYAEQKGYKVTPLEAKANLMALSVKNAKKLDPNRNFTSEELDRMYQKQVMAMGEKETVEAWRRVLLFRRLFDDVGSGVFVDSLLYKEFHKEASQGAKVAIYKPKKAIQLSSLEETLQFELYLEAISLESEKEGLPKTFFSLEEMMKRNPELVQKRFLIRLVKVEKDKLELDIALRKMMDWQLEEKNWKVLKEAFPELASCTDMKKRMSFIEGLDPDLQEKITAFTRKSILNERPEFIREKLSSMVSEVQKLDIALAGDTEVLPGIKDRKRLIDLLERGALLGQEATEQADISEKLSCYTEDDKVFYRLRIVDRGESYEIMPFSEAKQKGVLRALLQKRLEKEYALLKTDEAFDVVAGKLKKILASKLQKREFKNGALEESDEAVSKKLKERRFIPFMREMQERLKKGEDLPTEEQRLLSKDRLEPSIPFSSEWGIEKEEMVVFRKMKHPLFNESIFQMQPGEWSDVVVSDETLFYHMGEKVFDEEAISRGMQEGRHILGNEAKKHLMKQLIQEMEKKEAGLYRQGDRSLS